MPVKMSGRQYRAFMNADWGSDDAYWEDCVVTVDGVAFDQSGEAEDVMKDDSLVVLEGGFIVPDANAYDCNKLVDVERFARKWLKAQTTETFVIEVDKDKIDDVKAAIKAMKGVKFVS